MRLLPKAAVSLARGALVLAPLLLGGCGYSVRPNYDKNIKTIYVPMFRSFSYRKDVQFQLTYLVQHEIQNRTPWKVVTEPEGADATLTGVIKFVDKMATVESPNNLPRQVTATLMVEAKLVDNRELDVKKDFPPAVFYEQATFYPELGETSQLGFTRALERLAKQIVDNMENRW
jgi:hypothetical protein